MRSMKRKNAGRGSRPLKRFFTLAGVFIMSALIVAMLGGMAFEYLATSPVASVDTSSPEIKTDDYGGQTDGSSASEPAASEASQPEEYLSKAGINGVHKINVAILGVDVDGLRSDVNFVLSFDEDTKEINVVSIPRDTRVTMTSEMIKSLEDRDRENFIPYSNNVRGVCKLNEVHAYAGEGYRNEFTVMMLEDLLGIDIDYFVKINTSAFRRIVDTIGGIEYDVPQRLYYVDPYQDLYIDLRPGLQHLDGDKAEQLVRYREGYAQKDLARINVQQDFMKALIEKITNTQTILDNFPELMKTVFDCVETDVSFVDALKYVKYLKDIKIYNVSMTTVPGEPETIGGISYFEVEDEQMESLINEVFYNISPYKPFSGQGPQPVDFNSSIAVVTAKDFMEEK